MLVYCLSIIFLFFYLCFSPEGFCSPPAPESAEKREQPFAQKKGPLGASQETPETFYRDKIFESAKNLPEKAMQLFSDKMRAPEYNPHLDPRLLESTLSSLRTHEKWSFFQAKALDAQKAALDADRARPSWSEGWEERWELLSEYHAQKIAREAATYFSPQLCFSVQKAYAEDRKAHLFEHLYNGCPKPNPDQKSASPLWTQKPWIALPLTAVSLIPVAAVSLVDHLGSLARRILVDPLSSIAEKLSLSREEKAYETALQTFTKNPADLAHFTEKMRNLFFLPDTSPTPDQLALLVSRQPDLCGIVEAMLGQKPDAQRDQNFRDFFEGLSQEIIREGFYNPYEHVALEVIARIMGEQNASGSTLKNSNLGLAEIEEHARHYFAVNPSQEEATTAFLDYLFEDVLDEVLTETDYQVVHSCLKLVFQERPSHLAFLTEIPQNSLIDALYLIYHERPTYKAFDEKRKWKLSLNAHPWLSTAYAGKEIAAGLTLGVGLGAVGILAGSPLIDMYIKHLKTQPIPGEAGASASEPILNNAWKAQYSAPNIPEYNDGVTIDTLDEDGTIIDVELPQAVEAESTASPRPQQNQESIPEYNDGVTIQTIDEDGAIIDEELPQKAGGASASLPCPQTNQESIPPVEEIVDTGQTDSPRQSLLPHFAIKPDAAAISVSNGTPAQGFLSNLWSWLSPTKTPNQDHMRVKRTPTKPPLGIQHPDDPSGLLDDLSRANEESIKNFGLKFNAYYKKYTPETGYSAGIATVSNIMYNFAVKTGGTASQFRYPGPAECAFDKNQWAVIPPSGSSDLPILLVEFNNEAQRNGVASGRALDQLRIDVAAASPGDWEKKKTLEARFFSENHDDLFDQILAHKKKTSKRHYNSRIQMSTEEEFRAWKNGGADKVQETSLDNLVYGTKTWKYVEAQIASNPYLQNKPIVRLAIEARLNEATPFKILYSINTNLFDTAKKTLAKPMHKFHNHLVESPPQLTRHDFYNPGSQPAQSFQAQETILLSLLEPQFQEAEMTPYKAMFEAKFRVLSQIYAGQSFDENFFKMFFAGDYFCHLQEGSFFLLGELQSGRGRIDLAIISRIEGKNAAILEFKFDLSSAKLFDLAGAGFKQADTNNYGIAFNRFGLGGKKINRVGIACSPDSIQMKSASYEVPEVGKQSLSSLLAGGSLQAFRDNLWLSFEKYISYYDLNKRNPSFLPAVWGGLLAHGVSQGDFDHVYALPNNNHKKAAIFLTSPTQPDTLICLQLFGTAEHNTYTDAILNIKQKNSRLEKVTFVDVEVDKTSIEIKHKAKTAIEELVSMRSSTGVPIEVPLSAIPKEHAGHPTLQDALANLDDANNRKYSLDYLEKASAFEDTLFPRGGRKNEGSLQGKMVGPLINMPEILLLSVNEQGGSGRKRPDIIIKAKNKGTDQDKVTVFENKMVRSSAVRDLTSELDGATDQTRRNHYGDVPGPPTKEFVSVGLVINLGGETPTFGMAHDTKPYEITDLHRGIIPRDLDIFLSKTPERRSYSDQPVTTFFSPPRSRTPHKRPATDELPGTPPRQVCKFSPNHRRKRSILSDCVTFADTDKKNLAKEIYKSETPPFKGDAEIQKNRGSSRAAHLGHVATSTLPFVFQVLDQNMAGIGIGLGRIVGEEVIIKAYNAAIDKITKPYTVGTKKISAHAQVPQWVNVLKKSKIVAREIPGFVTEIVLYAIEADGYIRKFKDGSANDYDAGKFAVLTISCGASSAISIAFAAGAMSNPIFLGATAGIFVAERLYTSYSDAFEFMEGLTSGEIFELGTRKFFGARIPEHYKHSQVVQRTHQDFFKDLVAYFPQDSDLFIATIPAIRQEMICSFTHTAESVRTYLDFVCNLDSCCGRYGGSYVEDALNTNQKFLELYPTGFPVCLVEPAPRFCLNSIACDGSTILRKIAASRKHVYASENRGKVNHDTQQVSEISLQNDFLEPRTYSPSRLFPAPEGTEMICSPNGDYPNSLSTQPPFSTHLSNLVPYFLNISSFDQKVEFFCGEDAPLVVYSTPVAGKNYCNQAVVLKRTDADTNPTPQKTTYYFANHFEGTALQNRSANVVVDSKAMPELALNFTASNHNDYVRVLGELTSKIRLDGGGGSDTLHVSHDISPEHYAKGAIVGFNTLFASSQKPLSVTVMGDFAELDISQGVGHKANISNLSNGTISVAPGQDSIVHFLDDATAIYTLPTNPKHTNDAHHRHHRTHHRHRDDHQIRSTIVLDPQKRQPQHFKIESLENIGAFEIINSTLKLKFHAQNFYHNEILLQNFCLENHPIIFLPQSGVDLSFIEDTAIIKQQLYVQPLFQPSFDDKQNIRKGVGLHLGGTITIMNTEEGIHGPIELNKFISVPENYGSMDFMYSIELHLNENGGDQRVKRLFKGGVLSHSEPHTVLLATQESTVVDYSLNPQPMTYMMKVLPPSLKIYSPEQKNKGSWDALEFPPDSRVSNAFLEEGKHLKLTIKQGNETGDLVWENFGNRHVIFNHGGLLGYIRFNTSQSHTFGAALFGQFTSGAQKVYQKKDWESYTVLRLPVENCLILHQAKDVVLFDPETQGRLVLEELYEHCREPRGCGFTLLLDEQLMTYAEFNRRVYDGSSTEEYALYKLDQFYQKKNFYEQSTTTPYTNIKNLDATKQSFIKLAPTNDLYDVKDAHNGTIVLETRAPNGGSQFIWIKDWDNLLVAQRPLLLKDNHLIDLRKYSSETLTQLHHNTPLVRPAFGPFSPDPLYVHLIPFDQGHLLSLSSDETPTLTAQYTVPSNEGIKFQQTLYTVQDLNQNSTTVVLFHTFCQTVHDVAAGRKIDSYIISKASNDSEIAFQGRTMELIEGGVPGLSYLTLYRQSQLSNHTEEETAAFFTIPVAVPENELFHATVRGDIANNTVITFISSMGLLDADREKNIITLSQSQRNIGRVEILGVPQNIYLSVA